jgi:hypothetical protein
VPRDFMTMNAEGCKQCEKFKDPKLAEKYRYINVAANARLDVLEEKWKRLAS